MLLLCRKLHLQKLSIYIIFLAFVVAVIPLATILSATKRDKQLAGGAAMDKLDDEFFHEQYYKTKPLLQMPPVQGMSLSRLFSLSSAGQNGPYVKLHNFLPRTREFAWHSAITLCTHGTVSYLQNLIPLSHRWDGPISVAVFAPQKTVALTVKGIYILHRCYHQIRDKVTFHVYYDSRYMQEATISVDFTSLELASQRSMCDDLPAVAMNLSNRLENKATNDTRLWYPVNVGRNIARINAHTHYVLPLDIELLPSGNFNEKFFRMLKQNDFLLSVARSSVQELAKPKVFVLPAFEVSSGKEQPTNKSRLQQLIDNKKAVYFHKFTCGICHKMPYYDLWLAKPEDGSFDIFFVTKWIPPFWEPVYVGTNAEPLYDERFKGYGSNKIQQVYELCRADYDFFILDEAFVMHSGITKPSKETKALKPMIVSNVRLLSRFSREMDKKYENPKTKQHCKFKKRKDSITGYFPSDVLGTEAPAELVRNISNNYHVHTTRQYTML